MTPRSPLLAVLVLAMAASAQPPGPGGPGPYGPRGGGPGGGGPQDPARAADREIFHYLIDHREEITRQVKEIPGGVETVTESQNPAVMAKIRTHVGRMKARLEEGRPIRRRDPLFAEIFRHADRITMRVEDTPHGVRVVETSDDPWVTRLIREHARVIDRFVAHGYDEVRRDHALPPRP